MKALLRFGAAAVVTAATVAAMGQGIQVTVDGQQVNFRGQQPMMSGDRVMVPLRGVFERMGANVNWDPSNETVYANKSGTRVRLRIGQTTASVNGQPVNLDVPAQVIDGSTMVPLRFVSEAFGENVKWDANEETVQIFSGNGPDYRFPGRTRTSEGRAQRIRGELRTGDVIPVYLNDPLSSNSSYRGERFTAYVGKDISFLPSGTTIEGTVRGARAREDDRPGVLEIAFDRIDLPNGDSIPITGSLVSMNESGIRYRNGRYYSSSTLRSAYVGYGAGPGVVMNVSGSRSIENTPSRSFFGFGVGANARSEVHNVTLDQGKELGVRLDSSVNLNR